MSKRTEGDEYRKGLWTVEEDNILMDYVKHHGKGHWNRIARKTGLNRCGKSCRLRWMNYLRPNVKKGNFTDQEEDLIIRLHKLLGNRWSLIAKRVPGRTDNQVKNYWNTHLSKKLGVKDQTTGGGSNGQNCTGATQEKSSDEKLVEKTQNREEEEERTDEFLSDDFQAAPMVEEDGDYIGSFLVGNEFEFGSLGNFMDGYYF